LSVSAVTGSAVTAAVKAELSQLPAAKACCRRAELSALLRFAGGLRVAAGRVVIEAELDSGLAARRVRREIGELYGQPARVRTLPAAGLRDGPRYLVWVERDGAVLARCTGLVDRAGRPVRGLPSAVVSGGSCDAAAAWRGALLARGSLSQRRGASALEVAAPGPEAALALIGAARRLGVDASSRHLRGVERVTVRDDDAIEALLCKLGAAAGVQAWQQRQQRREVRGTASTLANFDSANQRRSADASAAAVARVRAALALLAGDAPEHLLAVGRLRLEHPQASLEELGTFVDPPVTKDAVAGRLRRLLSHADRQATSKGVPPTRAAVDPELAEAVDRDLRTHR